jgi:hypothetical protein
MFDWREPVSSRHVWTIMVLWDWIEQRLGREPTAEDYASWWHFSKEGASQELARFRDSFPGEATPSRLNRLSRQELEASLRRPGKPATPHAVCPQCRVIFPLEPAEELRRQVLEIERLFRPPGGGSNEVEHFRDRWGLSQDHFKLLMVMASHLEPQPGICHQCGSQVDEAALTICRKCRRLNLNWEVAG